MRRMVEPPLFELSEWYMNCILLFVLKFKLNILFAYTLKNSKNSKIIINNLIINQLK